MNRLVAGALPFLALAACASKPPERDVFLPPYAEKGCWARLYGEPGFAGRMRQLEGPTFVESMTHTAIIVPEIQRTEPQPLLSDVRSLEVGPHARLVGFAAPLFQRRDFELPPGAKLAETAEVGFYERVRSFRLDCVAG